MKQDKSQLVPRAMTYGLIMGLIWSVKYLFFIFSSDTPIFNNIYWGCTFAVPYIAYLFTKRYRAEIGGFISFYHAWRFGVMVYFFAALIVSVSHFVFYEFLAPENFVANALQQTMQLFENADMKELSEAVEGLNISPIHMTIQQIFNNIFYGILFSIPVALLVKRKATEEQKQ